MPTSGPCRDTGLERPRRPGPARETSADPPKPSAAEGPLGAALGGGCINPAPCTAHPSGPAQSSPSGPAPAPQGPAPEVALARAAPAMGKEQELLEAARTGNLPAVEKLLSGKRLSSGFGGSGGGGGGSGGSAGGGGGGSGGSVGVGHPLSSLLR